jgi:hypothetical protein
VLPLVSEIGHKTLGYFLSDYSMRYFSEYVKPYSKDNVLRRTGWTNYYITFLTKRLALPLRNLETQGPIFGMAEGNSGLIFVIFLSLSRQDAGNIS